MSNIKAVLEFLRTFVGVPYRWHKAGDPITADAPFWVSAGPPPSRSYIDAHDKSIVCTGLINLAARYVGAPIPGLSTADPFAGTTGAWFEYLEAAGLLETLDTSKKYPIGTLILRNFGDLETDQGHVAVVENEFGPSILDQTILHSYATEEYSSNALNAGEVGYTLFRESHYYLDAATEPYYTHVCYPAHWLSR